MALFRSKSRAKLTEPAPALLDWMAWPTLRESNSQRPVVGTSHYQAAIEAAARGRTERGPNNSLVMAELRAIGSGQYEGGIEVRLGGALAGHLPHDRSDKYHPVLSSLEQSGMNALCRAAMVTSCTTWSRAR
jgi:hypothetical protein